MTLTTLILGIAAGNVLARFIAYVASRAHYDFVMWKGGREFKRQQEGPHHAAQ